MYFSYQKFIELPQVQKSFKNAHQRSQYVNIFLYIYIYVHIYIYIESYTYIHIL